MALKESSSVPVVPDRAYLEAIERLEKAVAKDLGKVSDRHWAGLLRVVGDYEKSRRSEPDSETSTRLAEKYRRRQSPRQTKAQSKKQPLDSPGRVLLRSIARVYCFLCPTRAVLRIVVELCEQANIPFAPEKLVFAHYNRGQWHRSCLSIGLSDVLLLLGNSGAISEYARFGTLTPEVVGHLFGPNSRGPFVTAWRSSMKTTPVLGDYQDHESFELVPTKLRRRGEALPPNWAFRYGTASVLKRENLMAIAEIRRTMSDDAKTMMDRIRSQAHDFLEPIRLEVSPIAPSQWQGIVSAFKGRSDDHRLYNPVDVAKRFLSKFGDAKLRFSSDVV